MTNQPSNTPPSRRDFLARAGQFGIALPILGPHLRELLQLHPSAPRLLRTAGRGLTAPVSESAYSGLRWRLLGPFRGGRSDAATGVPGRPNEFYFGAVNGGVWKSIDAGRVWEPVFDGQPVASIGAIAVAASAPDTVYVGTGESTLRDSMGYGNGVYKSTDAGKTWTHLGLDETQHIAKIAVDPKNANIVFVAAIGHMYAANPERGVFRTIDGGKTWQKVLFKNDDVGACDVVIDPTNSRIVYASLWNTRRPPWYTYGPSNGPGGGIYKSIDGGTTWKELTAGLPKDGIGKSGIAVSASNPKRVWAIVDDLVPAPPAPGAAAAPATPPAANPLTAGRGGGRGGGGPTGQGGLFRSEDGGATWTKIANENGLWGRGWYFEHIAVDPKNADIIYIANTVVIRSKDGGKTWDTIRGSPGGDDYHQPWVSPDDSNTIIVASDQGTVISRNAAADDPTQITWSSWLNQPTAQIYHVAVDYRFPYWVVGAQQDSGGVAVCSRGKFAQISMRDWMPIGAAGESGDTAGDPLHPGIIYGGSGGRFDLELNESVGGTAQPQLAGGEQARTDWTAPLALSKADPRALYYANQCLFKSTDTAASWTQISGDLTRPNPGVPATLDAASAADFNTDNHRNGQRGVIYRIAPSPVLVPMVWIGTDDGFIQVTLNDGKSWQNVTPPALTAWSRITSIEASHFDMNVAYVTVDRHQLQDFDPYIYRTRDLGKTWQKITAGLPAGVYAHVVKEDPMRQGLLFAGTERGLFISFDDGDNWQSFQQNIPATSMRDLMIYQNDLIVATHGRGFWVVDDISALRQIDDKVLQADAYLFKPSDAYRVIQGGDNGTGLQKDEPQAPNPPNGALIDYYLKSNAAAVTIDILDAAGATVQTFTTEPVAAPAPGGTASPAGATPLTGRGGRGGGGRAAPSGGTIVPGTGAGTGISSASPLWNRPAEPFSGAAGMHRVTFNPGGGAGRGGGGGRGRGGAAAGPAPQLTGVFTAKLTVNGQSQTQTFLIKADPRSK